MKLFKLSIITSICVFAIGLAILSWGKPSHSIAKPDQKSSQPIIVEAKPVTRQSLKQTLDVTATVKSDRSVILKSESSGRITHINFAEGDAVTKGQSLILLNADSERATLNQEKANLSLKEITLSRVSQLHNDGIISSQRRDEAKTDVTLAKAKVELAQAELNKKIIHAPFSGIMGIRAVNVGDLIESDRELVTINDNKVLRIIFDVPENIIKFISKGTFVDVEIDQQKTTALAINFIEQSVNPSTRTVSAQIVVNQTEAKDDLNLIAGQYVKVSVPTETIKNAIVIPEQGLIPRGAKTFIYKIPNGKIDNLASTQKAILTPVTILLRTSGVAAIAGEVNESDLIVTAGQQKLRGYTAPVKVKAARDIKIIPSAIEQLPRASQ